MAWDYFREGTRARGVKILHLLDATQSKDTTRYLAVCERCGQELDISHSQVLKRIGKGRVQCMGCRRKAAETPSDGTMPGAIQAGPHLWWTLGPLGPRWGESRGSNQWIGQGASE